MIKQQLKELGINDTEISVYLAIVKHGRIAPAAIGKVTGINRTTVYSAVKQLVAKGLVAEDLGTRPIQLAALPVDDLVTMVDREEQALNRKREAVAGLAPALKKLAKHADYSVPKITFIEDDKVESYLYKRSRAWSDSIMTTDGVWWGYQDHAFVESDGYRKWIDWYWRESAPAKLQLKLLSNESDIESRMAKLDYKRRHIRFWQEATEFTATTWVNGDYIVMIYTRTRPHYLVEIHDRVMAHNFRELFKGIWISLE